MSQPQIPVTTAVRFLREKNVAFEPQFYEYVEHGGTRVSAQELDVDEHAVVKTLVMKGDGKAVLIVLMHGDKEVSTKQLARILGMKRVEPCDEATAQRQTGYVFGGTSPFGTRNRLPVYAERSIFSLPKIYINGGKRGFLVAIDPKVLKEVLPLTEVDVAVEAA